MGMTRDAPGLDNQHRTLLNGSVVVAAAPSQLDLFSTLIDMLIPLWPLWLLVFGVGLLRIIAEGGGRKKKRHRRSSSPLRQTERPAASSRRQGRPLRPQPVTPKTAQSAVVPDDIDAMTGTQFEKRLEVLFRDLGNNVEHTGRLGDFGADLVLEQDGTRTVVQAKRSSNEVGLSAVREALAAKGMYDSTEAMVVTNSTFTWRAKRLAAANNVILWDRAVLMKHLLAAADGHAPTKPEPAVLDTHHCARCGDVVTDREREYCLQRTNRFRGLAYCYGCQRAL